MTDDLLAEIIANPRHTALRLVYADQLVERGDPRGELIQLACARGPMTAERRARHDELIARETAVWKQRRLEVVFERGFVRKVTGHADAIVAAHALLAREPVAEIKVFPAEDLRPFATLPLLARIGTLLVDRALTDAAAFALAGAELSSLRALRLIGALGPDACRALGRAAWARGLAQLWIYGGTSEIRVESLVEQGGPTAIELASCRIGPAIADVVQRLPRLQSCKLYVNRIGGPGVLALATVRLERLANLELSYEEIGEIGLRALGESTAWPALRRLGVGTNALGDAGVEVLAASPICTRLVELDVSCNAISTRGCRALAESPQLAQLRFLDVRANRFDLDGVRALASGLPALERLGLGRMNDDIRAIFAHRPSLRVL